MVSEAGSNILKVKCFAVGRMLFPARAFEVEFPDLHSFESTDKSLESFLLPLLFGKVQGLAGRC